MSYAIEIQNLKKTYRRGVEALKGINLKIEKGEFFALLGPNGAGKSTLLKIISTVSRKTEGKVYISGHDLDKDIFNSKLRLGITPQEVNLNIFEKSMDILIAQAGYFGISKKEATKKATKLLAALNLEEKADSRVIELSGGMKRRLMIARAMIHEPEILILDEPTAGVDIEIRRSMWDYIRKINQQGVTVLLTTHYLEEAEQLCNKVAIIDHGEIIQNTGVSDLLKSKYKKSFILNTSDLDDFEADFEGFAINVLDKNSMEIIADEDENLNQLFQKLSEKNITVFNLRNKSNRLEELFLKLTGT